MLRYLLLLLTILLLPQANAQSLTVSGDVAKPLTLGATDLRAMPRATVRAVDHDGQTRRYSGVPLSYLLQQAGVPAGRELRGKNLAKYVLVQATDGYEVVFALPELDPEFTTRTILLADSVDGAALPAGAGPFRVIVPDEKRPTRWVRQVTSIQVRLAR